jgi:hypothetical protein
MSMPIGSLRPTSSVASTVASTVTSSPLAWDIMITVMLIGSLRLHNINF